jgi:hypothetical protein
LEIKDLYYKHLVKEFMLLQKQNKNQKYILQNILDLLIISIPRIKGGRESFPAIANKTSKLRHLS